MASNVYERDSVMGQAQNLGNYWIQNMPLDAEDKLLAELQKVTSDDVKAVAAKYFGDDQAHRRHSGAPAAARRRQAPASHVRQGRCRRFGALMKHP